MTTKRDTFATSLSIKQEQDRYFIPLVVEGFPKKVLKKNIRLKPRGKWRLGRHISFRWAGQGAGQLSWCKVAKIFVQCFVPFKNWQGEHLVCKACLQFSIWLNREVSPLEAPASDFKPSTFPLNVALDPDLFWVYDHDPCQGVKCFDLKVFLASSGSTDWQIERGFLINRLLMMGDGPSLMVGLIQKPVSMTQCVM